MRAIDMEPEHSKSIRKTTATRRLARWCSWLSHLVYTEKVGSSILSRVTQQLTFFW
jgi:hypothetical protein